MLQFLLTLTDESNHGKIEHLYNKYHDYMMKCAVTKFKSLGRSNYTYDAEDAVQNAFMKITRYIDNIDFSRDEKDVKNYCLAILSNEICNVLSDNQENYEFDEEFSSAGEYNFIEELNLTQKEMSEMLHMSESSYSDIETGKSNCGTLTTVLLLSIQEDPTHFLSTVNVEFQKWYAKEMMPV